MIVLDASVLIAHLDARDVHHTRARALLAGSGRLPLAANALTVAEALVGPIRTGRGPQVHQAIAALGVTALELPAAAAYPLAELRAATGLKMPDAVVLLTAEHHQAVLMTFDDKLHRCAEQRGVAVRAQP